MLRFIFNLWLTVWLGFLTAAVIESRRPGDLSEVQGLDTPQGKPVAGTPDLAARMEQSAWRRAETLTINEGQANHYISSIITGLQGHATSWFAKFEHVALQFEPGYCRVWFIWRAHGQRRTASLDLTIKREGQYFITEVQGGQYGRLPILRRGALVTLVPACRNLCDALDEEIQKVFQMNEIRFEKHRVVLDPRFEVAK